MTTRRGWFAAAWTLAWAFASGGASGSDAVGTGDSGLDPPTAVVGWTESEVFVGTAADRLTIQGAGATFPAPLYERWFADYHKMNPDIRINYQKLGSGAGIEQFTRGLVQFGASDAAMTDEQIAKVPAEAGVLLVPMTAGSVVLAYNLPTVADLKLSRATYAGIFLGRITRWNDPAIAKDNPGLTLPALEISVVHRSDGSGTSYVFTQHLSAISGEWAQGPGKGTSVKWPAGIGAKGSDGVIAAIKQTEGAIGYIEYGFAFKTRMPMAILENKAGKLVRATVTSARAALAEAELPDDLRAWVPDPAGDESYPIVTYTWLLVNKKYKDSRVAETLKSVITYGLNEGQRNSEALGYIPLPAAVVERALKVTQQIGS